MPSRVIRGEINRSRSLNRVSRDADLTFRCLLMAVDDYGRADARPEALKADLFPCRAEVTADMVMEWIRELEAEGCVRLYEVDGEPYLCLPGWEKHRGNQKRAGASRLPDPPPPENPPGIPGDPRRSGNPQDIRPSGSGSGSVGEGVGDERDAGPGGPDTPGSPEPEPEPPEPQRPQEKPPDLKAQVREIWPQCQRAAKGYGRRWDTLGDARLEAMVARLKEHRTRGPTVLVEAIHGYVLARRPREPDQSAFDWRRYCAPETIYQRSKFPLYVEAFDEQQAESAEQSRAPPREPSEAELRAIVGKLNQRDPEVPEIPPEAHRAYARHMARAQEKQQTQ